ncbi:glycoside hydrolase family 31 protein [Kiritimatiellaeota bacterium B1221]|nr:glycoside hydrolase family 31 protein [Kiritimatiellaeota bacterium B1221]
MSFSPLARPESIIKFDRARFTVLSSRSFRIEWAEDGNFEDRATLKVVNRHTSPVPFKTQPQANSLRIDTEHCTLIYTPDGKPFSRNNLEIRFKMNEKTVRWWPGKSDPHNLKGTATTLDEFSADKAKIWISPEDADPEKEILERDILGNRIFQGDMRKLDLGQGLLSRSGWAVVDESSSVVLDPSLCDWQPWVREREPGQRQDLYFFGYGLAFKDALRETQQLFGPQPLLPRALLGYWYSRYWAYTDQELLALVDEFDRMDLPLDVLVIDMDWHKAGWTGYSWDPDYFPDPKALLETLHSRGVLTTLNLHPADGVFDYEDAFPQMCKHLGISPDQAQPIEPRFHDLYRMHKRDPEKGRRIPLNVCDPAYMRAYFDCLHHPLEKQGVDFWWMDWQQGSQGSHLPNLDTLPWINEIHWQDQCCHHPDTRPVNFSRYGGIGAGRMPVGFSGDTYINWETLQYQPYFTATAANVLYGTWSHDIGGHMCGTLTPELYTRWIQFGVYSPILRTHASKQPESERRVHRFPEPYRSQMMQELRRRYELVPYIYGQLRKSCESAISLVSPLYYEWPDCHEAYEQPQQYLFGEDMILAPVTCPVDPHTQQAVQQIWLPPGEWIDTAHGEILPGNQNYTRGYRLEETPIFVRPGTVIPEQAFTRRLKESAYPEIRFRIYAGKSGSGCLYEDDGKSLAWKRGESVELECEHAKTGNIRRVKLHPARGEYKGFRANRKVRLLLEGLAPPRNVSEGKWSYHGNTFTLEIDLGNLDLRQSHCIQIEEASPQQHQKIQNLKGQFTRLTAVSSLVCSVSPTHPKHPDERLAVHIAQTGRRISLCPDSFAEEMKDFNHSLQRLPVVLETMQNNYRNTRIPVEKGVYEILGQARSILDGVL